MQNTAKPNNTNQPSIVGNPYTNKEIDISILQSYNELIYKNGLVSYDIYQKAKEKIERL